MEMRWSVKMAKALISDRPVTEEEWDCSIAFLIKALGSVYKRTDDREVLGAIKAYGEYLFDRDGNLNVFFQESSDMEMLKVAGAFVSLFRITRDERYKKASHILWNKLKTLRRTAEGVFVGSGNYEYISVNSIYDVSEFYSGHISAFKYTKKYGDLTRQFMVVYNNLRDKESGLLNSCYDRTKKAVWCNKNTGLSDCIYTVSVARYLFSLTDFINCLDYSQPDTKILIGIYRELIDSVLKYRDKSGTFFSVINQMQRKGNYLESTSTMMILYALAKGINIRILFGEKYNNEASQIYNGIIDEFVMISSRGSIDICKICDFVESYDDFSFSALVSMPIISNDLKAKALFVLAMGEYEKLKGINETHNKVHYCI
jgi:unsaturated rhamnogalacturonyl hydrolase